jgi:integrase/recombinase XerD
MTSYEEKINLYFELKDSPESSRDSYMRRIKAFIKFLEDRQTKIEESTEADIQQYILHLKKEKGLSAGTINTYISGIKFFWVYVMGKEWDTKKLPRMKRTQSMPVILSAEKIIDIINAVDNLKHKAILALIYSSGLRVSEVAKLRICDILSNTMQIRVEGAKHDTNRYTILSQSALKILRDYFRAYHDLKSYQPTDWLFYGLDKKNPVHVKTIKNLMIKIRNRLMLDNGISAHTLRHCFATHSLEDGVEPVIIQQLLGHKRLQTTTAYLHMTSKALMGVKSPLDTRGGGNK